LCLTRVVAQSLCASDRLSDVRYDTATPKANLVTEDPPAPRPARSDRAFGDDAPLGTVGIANRSLLDHELSLR
jgi:hypothetical protein